MKIAKIVGIFLVACLFFDANDVSAQTNGSTSWEVPISSGNLNQLVTNGGIHAYLVQTGLADHLEAKYPAALNPNIIVQVSIRVRIGWVSAHVMNLVYDRSGNMTWEDAITDITEFTMPSNVGGGFGLSDFGDYGWNTGSNYGLAYRRSYNYGSGSGSNFRCWETASGVACEYVGPSPNEGFSP